MYKDVVIVLQRGQSLISEFSPSSEDDVLKFDEELAACNVTSSKEDLGPRNDSIFDDCH